MPIGYTTKNQNMPYYIIKIKIPKSYTIKQHQSYDSVRIPKQHVIKNINKPYYTVDNMQTPIKNDIIKLPKKYVTNIITGLPLSKI
jgi:hypothetical protein